LDIQYDEKTKKLLIALLLFISCIVSALMLAYSPERPYRDLQSFAEADSLIRRDLGKFNISPGQVRVTVIRVDSSLVRKIFRVNLPPGFHKTRLHAELNRTFNPLSVGTPASVTLPERDMLLQLIYRGTVIRSLDLRTDPDLVMQRNYASLMVAFESAPTRAMLNEVVKLGETVPVVLQVSDAGEARQLEEELRPHPSRIYYWLTGEAELDGEEAQPDYRFPPLLHLREFEPRVHILSFTDLSTADNRDSQSAIRIAAEKDITFIDASNALILDSDLGELLFRQELEKFEQQAIDGSHPVAIVLADDRALDWLGETLNDLKRRGLYLTRPPEISF